nr:hypothetical protein [Tanacetum cinerariifolium]
MGDMRREMGDMQAELLALREQPGRARQPGEDARVPDHQDALRDTDRKLSSLTVEEHFAFNVSLRMFTRSIVIQRRVEDLQLGVESYQKRLNLTKPDMYRSDLKQQEAYTAYSNPRGFIYQNKDKKNRLIRIDKLYKFSDGTLNDVCNALDDRLKGIRMQYLPQTIWRKGLLEDDCMRVTFRCCKGPYDSSYAAPILAESYKVVKYRSKSENNGIVPTEMELALEQTQQGTSHEVSVSTEGVEELKRKYKIKGEKKEALLTLR